MTQPTQVIRKCVICPSAQPVDHGRYPFYFSSPMSYYTRVIGTQNYTPPQQLRSELDWNTIWNQGPFLSNRDVDTTRENTIIISS